VRFLRGVAGALLWLVAAVLGLVGVLLCVTLILLPIGIPLLLLARKMFTRAVQLLMPPKLAHPVKELGKASKGKGKAVSDAVSDAGKDVAKKMRKGRRKGLLGT
jgi:hypothetical protein